MAKHARIVPVLLGAAVLLGVHALPANAVMQFRTFISSSGSDANTCVEISPCQSLAGAYANTAAGGEINILTGGDFGSLVIQKSIAIRGQGNVLGVTGGGTVISVSAGSTDVVNLVGLDILGNSSNAGIFIMGAGIVNIADCHFRNLSTAIDVNPTVTTFVSVKDSLFQNNLSGIAVDSDVTTRVVIDNVAVFGLGIGGFGSGISATNTHVSVVLNNSTIANNGTGLATLSGAKLFTYGNNRVNFNGDNGGPYQPVLTMK